MNDPRSIPQFLEALQPRIRRSSTVRETTPEGMRGVLDETIEALQLTVEELRVTHEELVEQQEALEQARRTREAEAARFQHLFRALPDALLVTDAYGVVHDANPAAGALLGVSGDGLRGKPLAVYVDDGSRRAFRHELAEAAGRAAPRRWELRLRPRTGFAVEVEASVVPLGPGPGAELAWRLRDLTAGRAGDATREHDAGTARALLASLPAAAAAMDRDGSVLFWNAAAARLLGWSEDEVVGLANPAIPDDLLPVLDGVRAAGAGAEPVTAAAEAQHKDGGRVPVQLTLTPLTGEGGEVRGTVALIAPAAAEEERPAVGAAAGRAWSAAEARRVLLGSGAEADFAERLRTGIAAGLHLGRLQPGARLPSIRDAAQAAATDHRIVSAAYQRLSSEGLVEVRNRRGASVSALPAGAGPELGESAEWLARALADAASLQLRVPQLPELMRRWTASATVRCACVESVEDEQAALVHELAHQWGLKTFPVAAGEGDAASRRALADALRDADLVVTTPFHAHTVRPVAELLGKPLVVACAHAEVVDALEDRLRRGPLTAVVADPAYGTRLRAVEGGERLRVVRADDAAAVDALDPAEPVLVTWAAQRRLRRPLRLLVPTSCFVSPDLGAAVARALVHANVEASRGRA